MAFNRIWGDKREKIVILDSNAIMMLFEFSINLEDELTRLIGKYHILVPKPVLRELKYLSEKGKGTKKINAKSSLKLIERYEIAEIDEKTVDDSVLSLAEKTNGIVFTNDKELKKRLKEKSYQVIFLRSKKKLTII